VTTWRDGVVERVESGQDIDESRAAAERLAQERAPGLAQLIERSMEAFNAGDFDSAVASYAPDALFYPRAVGVLEGPEAIRRFFEDWHGTYEDFTFELEEFRDLGNGVALGVVTQGGRLADTAARVHDRFALVFTGADGLIETETNFTDIDEARTVAEKLARERE
jgi:ketosteroid isomerase-like protein